MGKLPLKYISLGLLLAYSIRSLVLNSLSLNEVLVIGILAGLTAIFDAKTEAKQLTDLKNQIDQIEINRKNQEKIIDDIRTSIVSSKLSSGVRTMTSGQR